MYATRSDLIDRYGEDVLLMVADRDRDGVLDDALMDLALADATAEIDTYVGQAYRLPLAEVPSVLTRLCGDIALYQLSLDGGATEERRKRYEDAIGLLKQIASGQVSLGVPTPVDDSSGFAEFFSNDVQFNQLL